MILLLYPFTLDKVKLQRLRDLPEVSLPIAGRHVIQIQVCLL